MRTWGDDIFAGFLRLSDAEAKAKRDREVLRRVDDILHNNKITPRRLVLIIESREKAKRATQ